MEPAVVNKFAESGIITIDLEDFYPKEDIIEFDLKEFLFMGLILKEKDFRAALPQINWQQYANKYVAVTCTADAIIPVWAYMLVASYLQPFAKDAFFANKKELLNTLMLNNIATINPQQYADKRIVIKGCGDIQIPETAFFTITTKLRPYAKSIMYGEPCSTVPIYKKKL